MKEYIKSVHVELNDWDINDAINKLDVDRNGQISFEEFEAWCIKNVAQKKVPDLSTPTKK